MPGGDLLIHSGDISSLGRPREVESFIRWFNEIDNYTHKVFIAGNHDMSFDSEILMQNKIDYFDGKRSVWETEGNEHFPSVGKPQWLDILLNSELASNVYYLENSDVTIDGLKIWGSPITPAFGYGWALMRIDMKLTNTGKPYQTILILLLLTAQSLGIVIEHNMVD